MAEPTIQLGGGNWAGKSGNLLGYYEQNKKFYAEDFTFSRSTSGTRVNSSGLIETAQILGSELVTNGDFATDSDWSKSNATISGGKATITVTGGGFSQIFQSPITYVSGKKYKVTAEIQGLSGSNGKQIRFQDNGSNNGGLTSVNGLITLDETLQNIDITWTANNSSNEIVIARNTNSGDYSFTIDNVSVKEVFQNDIPRVDYLNNSNGSLKLEPQSTNLITYSEDFSNSSWTLFGTIQANSSVSPNGLTTATKLTHTHSQYNMLRVITGGVRTTSVFVKNVDADNFYIRGSSSGYAYYNFNTKTVNNNSLKVEYFANDWIRLSLTDSNGLRQFGIGVDESDLSESGNSVYVWGAQLEEKSYATSYIPTSGSSVTRNADACSLTNVADRINSSEGVLFVETSYVNKGYGNSIAITDGTNSQRVQMYFNNHGLSLLLVVKVNDTIVGTHTVSSSGINWDSTNKIAIKYKTNDMSFWLNGTKVAEDTSGTMFSANTLTKLGFDSGSGGSFYGKCNQIQVYSTALSDSELATLTTL